MKRRLLIRHLAAQGCVLIREGKQETGSRLDRMVELERVLAERDIVVYLRTKTGEDLGESPDAWIYKYAKR